LGAWDARTGERLHELDHDSNSANRLALSPDGKLLAASSYGENQIKDGYIYEAIRLRDLTSRKELRRCVGHKHSAASTFFNDIAINWSADGKTLVSSSCDDKTIRLWDAATAKQLRMIDAKQEWPASVVLSPDGKIVALGGYQDGTVRLWSAETGKELRSFKTPQQVNTLAFSPDGSMLASAGWGAICLWEPTTGWLLNQLDSRTNATSDLAFSRDGRTLVSGYDDGSVRLWEVGTREERACFTGHRGRVRAVAISRDGRSVASGSDDTTILVWDATAGAQPDALLSSEHLQTSWHVLMDGEASRAYRAIWRMALSPKQALPFLAKRLRPVAPLDVAQRKQVDQLLTDLDSDQFSVRQRAENELEKLGPTVAPALRKALEGKPALEVRRRIEALLAKLASERLRIKRALEAIAHMNTPEAHRLLESLASGDPGAWLTEEARAIRKRLLGKSVTMP
jgi:WD40 repeat protein